MGPFRDGWSRDDVEAVLRGSDPAQLLYVPIVVGLEAPACGPEWAEQTCVALASHGDATVRGNALLGIAHVARTCRELRSAASVRAVQSGLQDPEAYVRGHAQDARDDIEHYLKTRLDVLLSRLSGPDR